VATSPWLIEWAAGASPPFPLRDRAIVKAIACEAVCQTKLPLSRLSTTDLANRASADLGRSISPSTVWRILDTDAIKPLRVEHEYERGGALQYLAAWDVHRGRVLGRCEEKTGIDSFGRLVDQVMRSEPYRSASRVFWIVANGYSHRGQTATQRLRKAYRKAVLVHTPVHASWLNQVEIYFSIIQRKVLTPNDFASLDEVEERLRLCEELSNREPRPF
jgi:DDE superfamily endonuclease